ncbi:DNA polymerase III subunit delta [Chlamydia sp.]|uniref:DNA polymerase III subunit delta n=1 Tax=Chlamydia sp. TaxID=35827 RepID=UPI0025BF1295|nr:DNA polymerase III subunit delta [Chlamydia sp.]MBQ8498431.1 DNA polymerase III subunit delta [Chlamydia sp.]
MENSQNNVYIESIKDFVHRIESKRFKIIVIGSSSIEDKDIFLELYVAGGRRLVDGQRLIQQELLSWTDNFGLFVSEETIGVYQAEKMSASLQEFIIRYSKNPNPTLSLFLFINKAEFFSSFSEKLSNALCLSLFGEYFAERDSRMAQLLMKRSKEMQIACSLGVAKLFVSKFPQTGVLEILSEFQKLVCQIGDKTCVETSDIQAFVEKKESVSLWKLRDLLLRKDRVTAQTLIQSLVSDSGEDPLAILNFLRSQYLLGLRAITERSKDRKAQIFIVAGEQALLNGLNVFFHTESLIKNHLQDPLLSLETMVERL